MHAQAFFTQNGSNNVVVERQFSFNIENDLVSGFDGITKLVYIKSIQDTIEAVGKDFNQLKQNMADTQTLIAKVNDSATKAFNKSKSSKTKLYKLLLRRKLVQHKLLQLKSIK